MGKLVFIHLLNDFSGSPKVLSQVINVCQHNGYEIELYTGRNKDGFLSGITVNHHLYFYQRFENRYITLVNFFISQISLFFKLLRFRNHEVVFYINTMLPFGAALAGKLLGKPVCYHVHETSIQPPILKRFLRYIAQKTATKIIFVSKSVMQAELFIGKKEYVVYNALPDTFVKSANQFSYKWKTKGKFTVLMICSLKTYKGIYEFIDIARKCEDKNDIHFSLVFNAEQSEIDNYLSDLDPLPNITLIPRQTDVVPYYLQASLLLNLSRVDEWVETFGLTIIEAMAFGIPVIVPPIGGPTEIVTDGIEGYLISSYEKEEIAKKILELSDDKTKCLELSRHAKKRSKEFNQTSFENNILKAISA